MPWLDCSTHNQPKRTILASHVKKYIVPFSRKFRIFFDDSASESLPNPSESLRGGFEVRTVEKDMHNKSLTEMFSDRFLVEG
jgi:hypothetical protein